MIIYSFIALFSYMSGMMHDFHVSVCDIEYDNERKALEITHRIFLDDLEQGLTVWSGKTGVDILNPKDKPKLDGMINSYVTENFGITVNGKIQFPNYLGNKISGDVMLVFMEVQKVKKLSAIMVQNSILIDTYIDQINLVHIKNDGKTRSLKLDSRQSKDELVY